MTFCPVTNDLNKHIAEIEKQDAIDEAINELAVDIYKRLQAGESVWVNGQMWTLDDFLADFEIDVCYFASFIRGNPDELLAQTQERLNEFSVKLATKMLGVSHEGC